MMRPLNAPLFFFFFFFFFYNRPNLDSFAAFSYVKTLFVLNSKIFIHVPNSHDTKFDSSFDENQMHI